MVLGYEYGRSMVGVWSEQGQSRVDKCMDLTQTLKIPLNLSITKIVQKYLSTHLKLCL